jgi:hypothetical protein
MMTMVDEKLTKKSRCCRCYPERPALKMRTMMTTMTMMMTMMSMMMSPWDQGQVMTVQTAMRQRVGLTVQWILVVTLRATDFARLSSKQSKPASERFKSGIQMRCFRGKNGRYCCERRKGKLIVKQKSNISNDTQKRLA